MSLHERDSSESPSRRSVPAASRIESIDVLRGVALLGILVMNVQAFSMPTAAYFNPTAYGDLTGPNLWVWISGRMLADQKFMTIFSMLFGAGIVLMTSRPGRRDCSRGLHYRRMGWLLVLGLLHAHLLWSGDILFLYAVCGMLVYPLRGLRPDRLLVLGLLVIAVASLLSVGTGLSLPAMLPEDRAAITAEFWNPTAETIQAELAAYRGSWIDQQPVRSEAALAFETLYLVYWGLWRAAGLMLVGMALFKLGVFSAERSPRFYGMMAVAALSVGLPVQAYGIALDFSTGWTDWSFFLGMQFNYWPSIAVSLGYVGTVMLACKTPALRGMTGPFAAVGRTALTNYLLQTVVCTTTFYGHGLGLFGHVDRVGQLGLVVVVWAAQLTASSLWLRRFRFGPAEWVWRSLTYGTRPPLRRIPSRKTAA